uniref:Uncharacterized protein n=1 Tax=Proboscia inermis TaxID=420281 RepID=A0A7S0CIH6_9STRA
MLVSKFRILFETLLVTLIAVLYGAGAIFVTSHQGPASSPGNMYYAIWIAFFFALRVEVGCIEEMRNPGKKSNLNTADGEVTTRNNDHTATISDEISRSKATPSKNKESNNDEKRASTTVILQTNVLSQDDETQEEIKDDATTITTMITPDGNVVAVDNTNNNHHKDERTDAMQRWGYLCVFSTICFASACDAADSFYDDRNDSWWNELDRYQMWMVICPGLVMIYAFLIFLLHLNSILFYSFVGNPAVGTLLSFVSFGLWVTGIVVIMHSESSLAVNGFGEIITANLFYFTWASVITAGVNFMTNVKKLLRIREESQAIVLWFGMVKIALVIFGAATQIWRSIDNVCTTSVVGGGGGKSNMDEAEFSMCWRTQYALAAGAIGILVSSFCCYALYTMKSYVYLAEALSASILTMVFSAGTRIITGMGGPGESVGDLYYATWLAFMLSMIIGVNVFEEWRREPSTVYLDPCADRGVDDTGVYETEMVITTAFPQTTTTTHPSSPFVAMDDEGSTSSSLLQDQKSKHSMPLTGVLKKASLSRHGKVV